MLPHCGMSGTFGLADIVVPTQRWGEFARLAYSSCFMKVRPLLARSPCAPAWLSCCSMGIGITQAELCLLVFSLMLMLSFKLTCPARPEGVHTQL